MRSWGPAQLLVCAALELAVAATVASACLAVRAGYPLGELVPWWIVQHAWAYGWTTDVLVSLAAGGAAAVLGTLVIWLRPRATNYGDARFARAAEVRAARLLSARGLLLGRSGREYLRNDEPLHALVAAPTRSGKGVGIVIPNLLSWTGSAVVMDIKYENHQITSGFRSAHGQEVYRFSPADPSGRSHRYNPLDAVRPALAHRVSDLQRLATILVPAPLGGKDAFWQEEGRSLFLGVALYVLDTPGIPHTLGEIYRTLMAPQPLHEIFQHLLESREDLDPVCRASLGSFAAKAEKERSGVRSTLTAALNLWANPVIDAATSASDFDLNDLRRKPMTVYVAVSLDQLVSVARLLNLFFQQAISLLAQAMPGKDEPHQVLFLLDEFASLGRMDVLKDSLAFLAGFRVRICTILQGLGQLDDLYGRPGREAILQNSALQVVFAANDMTTSQYVSERLGTTTMQTVSRTFSSGSRVPSRTYASTGRALMLPEEVRQLGPAEAIVFKEGVRPVRGRKIRYFEDASFRKRLRLAAAVPELELEARPAAQFNLPQAAASPELAELRALSAQLALERTESGEAHP